MRRWLLGLVGAALLAVPLVLTQVKPLGVLSASGWDGVPTGLPTWLRVSILAGSYLIEWGPVLAGLLIIYYANRARP